MSRSVYEIDFTAQINALPEASRIYTVADQLHQAGAICWLAGGAVRDLWLGRMPLDVDLVTDASDELILQLFPKAILVGQKFGVYKLPSLDVSARNIILDLTVFREEDKYVDGRRPESIRRSTPEADAKRRDFTMNALFYDLKNIELIDFVDGVNDLQSKTLRCVGDAATRFQEDHLRLLRLSRFQAVFGFQVPVADRRAALENAALIKSVSGERIYDEIFKAVSYRVEKKFWSSDITQSLWKHLGGEFDVNLVSKLSALDDITFTNEERLVAGIMCVSGFTVTAAEFLKSRLKCSNDEYRLARKISDMNLALSPVDMAVKIDDDRDESLSLKTLAFLCGVDIAPKDLFKHTLDYLETHPTPLITGKDLTGVCAPQETTKYLQLARKAQFEKKVRTREEVLTYLKSFKN